MSNECINWTDIDVRDGGTELETRVLEEFTKEFAHDYAFRVYTKRSVHFISDHAPPLDRLARIVAEFPSVHFSGDYLADNYEIKGQWKGEAGKFEHQPLPWKDEPKPLRIWEGEVVWAPV
jgi:hypothetical protein